MISKSAKIYISGHTGLVGSALVRKYKKEGYTNLLLITHKELDLTDARRVFDLFKRERPEYVIVSAARVGGIVPNMTYPADFMYETLMMETNIIWAALKFHVKKLLYISCGCSYPTAAKQPMKEKYVLTGPPESTNEGFAVAKIAGIKLTEKINIQYERNFISCIPANTYGVGDHFGKNRSHVIPALIKRLCEAKINEIASVTLWGSGKAKREFIYVDDLANGVFLIMRKYNDQACINIGSGEAVSIKKLAYTIKKAVNYKGEIKFDATKPEGMKIRMLSSDRIRRLGFRPITNLEKGIKNTLDYYLGTLRQK